MSFATRPDSFASLDPSFTSQYHVLAEIGIGGSGCVYKVQRWTDGATFAAKIVAKDRIGARGLVKTINWDVETKCLHRTKDGAFVVPTEAYVLRRLNHPGVVGFVDLFACPRFYYLIMEHHGASWQDAAEDNGILPPSPPVTPPSRQLDFPDVVSPSTSSTPPTIEGPSTVASALAAPPVRAPFMRRSSSDLFEAIEQFRHFNEPAARYVFHQLVATVCDLASVGIRHNDIKDENIVLDERLRVKLVDFGSCVLYDVREPTPLQTGKFYGTSTFAAPEVFSNAPYDGQAAEIWALGVVLSLLLTGQHPFSSSEDALAGRIAARKTRISPLADDCLRRCLTVDTIERITLDELLHHPWITQRY
ncbi:hypothetical protein JCM10212_006408 [Sporobolomyces blumeae]